MGGRRESSRADSLERFLLSVFALIICITFLLKVGIDTFSADYSNSGQNTAKLTRREYLQEPTTNGSSLLQRRDDYTCGPGRPCRNGACCGESGFCGYGNTYCGPGCTSNCDAHAECGKDALIPDTKCPLNTCCSQYGFVRITRCSIFWFAYSRISYLKVWHDIIILRRCVLLDVGRLDPSSLI